MSDKDLEEVVCKAITKAGVNINADDIEDCHRVCIQFVIHEMFCRPIGNTLTVKAHCIAEKLAFKVHTLALVVVF